MDTEMLVARDDLQVALKEYFGFEAFKGNQKAIIESVLAGKDTFVIMPTGGGKSLCYQLPAILSEGTAIIVSPLIALMKNQVDLIRSYSRNDSIAHFLNSSLNKAQIRQVREDIMARKTKLLYVAPETLTKPENIEFLKDITVSFVAVDEAHCISEWGHDFRPEYRRIRQMIEMVDQQVPIVALTATATPKVREDIIRTLHLEQPEVFVSSFNRSNLYYEVRPKGRKGVAEKQIIQFIKSKPGKSGIIYVLSRKSAEEIAKLLQVNDIKAAPYHAGLEAHIRSETQDKFLMEEVDVIVATIAFGMGIDKPDIRFVIHYNIPKSIENYYQETGRAGRDGLEGTCIAFYSPNDIHKLEKFMRDKSLSEREMGAQLLLEIAAYAETTACRRKFLLHYFGEEYDESQCDDRCDNCRHPKEKVEGKEDVLKALKVIEAVKESQPIQQVVNIITGKRTQEINNYGYDKLEYFNTAGEQSSLYWNSIVRQALLQDLIYKDIEQFGLLRLTDKGRAYIRQPHSIMLSVNNDFEHTDEEAYETEKTASLDPELVGQLKDLRRKKAKEWEVPPYVIFQDPSLEDMATHYPTSMDELSHIQGVSKGKAERYGKPFINLIANYVEANDIEKPTEIVVKQVAKKSAKKVFIIQMIDKKLPLDDIADNNGLTLEELLEEIETIVASGTKVDIDYYLDDVMDWDQQDLIYDYFSESETPDLDEAYEELEDEGVTYEEIQLIRIKFMSEMAN